MKETIQIFELPIHKDDAKIPGGCTGEGHHESHRPVGGPASFPQCGP